MKDKTISVTVPLPNNVKEATNYITISGLTQKGIEILLNTLQKR